MKFIHYDVSTGEITRCGDYEPPTVGGPTWIDLDGNTQQPPGVRPPPEPPAGQAMLVGITCKTTNRTHYVSNGAVVAYTVEQAAAKETEPRRLSAWDNALMQWVDVRGLTRMKSDKWVDIKAAALAADAANITVQSVTFAADADTRRQLLDEALLAQMSIADGLPYSLDWERANGNAITLTAAQLKALIRAINQRTVQIRATARTLRSQIEAASTAAQLDTIVWP